MNKITSFSSLLLLVLILNLTPTLAEGNGEVNLTSPNSLYMSYDTEIRQISSEYAFNEEGFPIYFKETDTLVSVNFTTIDNMIYLTLGRNPLRTDVIDRHNIYVCFNQAITELRRFEIVNDGSKCSPYLHTYFLGQIRENYTYEIRIPRSLNGMLIPYEWFIGNGAGGGGGCTCDPATSNIFPLLSSVDSAYPVNTQDTVSIGFTHSGGGLGCFNAILILQYKPASSWVNVPTGSSSNFGTDTADCNGVTCGVSSANSGATYYKTIDLQQVDNDVDFATYFSCIGSIWNGYSSPAVDSSIYNGEILITTNFTNNSNYTTGETVYFSFEAYDDSPHLKNISLYINGTINETYTGTGTSNILSYTFSKTFIVGSYSMYGKTTDIFGMTNTTEIYYFTVTNTTTITDEGVVWFMFGGLLLFFSTLFVSTRRKRD